MICKQLWIQDARIAVWAHRQDQEKLVNTYRHRIHRQLFMNDPLVQAEWVAILFIFSLIHLNNNEKIEWIFCFAFSLHRKNVKNEYKVFKAAHYEYTSSANDSRIGYKATPEPLSYESAVSSVTQLDNLLHDLKHERDISFDKGKLNRLIGIRFDFSITKFITFCRSLKRDITFNRSETRKWMKWWLDLTTKGFHFNLIETLVHFQKTIRTLALTPA